MTHQLRNRVLHFCWERILRSGKGMKAIQNAFQNLIIEGAAIEVTLGVANGVVKMKADQKWIVHFEAMQRRRDA